MFASITITSLNESDINEIVDSFNKIGWNKPSTIYEEYLREEKDNKRKIIIAKLNDTFCGYVTIKWNSGYSEFRKNNIPEIADLNVLPDYRKQGIGTKLITHCEQIVIDKGYSTIGLGVGLIADYGSAQRLYIELGYMPDGKGLNYKNKAISYGESVIADDDLVIYLTKKVKGE